MVRIIGSVSGIGLVDMAVSGLKERYLDDLVVQEARLKEVRSPNDFLTKLSADLQEPYIQSALHRIDNNGMPEGNIYVVTPDDVFKYKKFGNRIVSTETRLDEKNGSGPVRQFFDYLWEAVAKNAKPGSALEINALFFNEYSRNIFELGVKDAKLIGLMSKPLVVPDYGTIYLYTFSQIMSPIT